MWDGESDTPSSSDDEDGSDSSSSDSDADEESQSAPKDKPEGNAKQEKSEKQPKRSVASRLEAKLGSVLRRKSAKKPKQPAQEDAATSHMPILAEPRVLHGHTLTKGATFREICYAIRDNAFVASDLPVVISLEVHACLEQQQMMVDIMKEAWKGMLIDTQPAEGKLPSLADLKRKILIKTKGLPLNGDDAKSESEEALTPQNSEEKSSGQEPPKPSKVLGALADLAVYTRAYHFSHFDQPGTYHQQFSQKHIKISTRGQGSGSCVLAV